MHPPIWFSTFWAWRQVFGSTEFIARVQAAFYSTLTLALVFHLGLRWFLSRRYGVFAMILLGVNAFFFTYALEIRPYPLVLMSAALSMLLYQRWLTQQSYCAALMYGLSCAVLMYVHYLLLVLILVQTIYFVSQRPSLHLRRQWLIAGILGMALWLPWLPILLSQVEHLREVNQDGTVGIQVTTQATSLAEIERLLRLATNDLWWLYALLLVIGIILSTRKPTYRLALLWALGVPGIAFAANRFVAIYTQRYFVYLTIGIALMITASLAALPRPLQTITFVGLMLVSIGSLPSQLPQRTPYRQVFQQMSIAAVPGDIVFFDRFARDNNFLRFQYRNYLSPELRASMVFDFDELQSLDNTRRIWHVTKDFHNASVRNHFRAIERTHPRVGGIGICDSSTCLMAQMMEAPPNKNRVLFGGEVGYRGVDVDIVRETRIELRLWWDVPQTPALDYSIGLHLLDQTGMLVAQNDGAINDFDQRTIASSQLLPEQIYIDHRVLQLPDGIPPGHYDLMLVVYQWWDGTRLLLPDGNDNLLIGHIDFPT